MITPYEAVALASLILIVTVLVTGVLGLWLTRRGEGTVSESSLQDLENRVKTYAESVELNTAELDMYLQEKVHSLERAAQLRMNYPRVLVADVKCGPDPAPEMKNIGTQADLIHITQPAVKDLSLIHI